MGIGFKHPLSKYCQTPIWVLLPGDSPVLPPDTPHAHTQSGIERQPWDRSSPTQIKVTKTGREAELAPWASMSFMDPGLRQVTQACYSDLHCLSVECLITTQQSAVLLREIWPRKQWVHSETTLDSAKPHKLLIEAAAFSAQNPKQSHVWSKGVSRRYPQCQSQSTHICFSKF